MIKNVYIYTDDISKDVEFRQRDIDENKIKEEDIFTDLSFEDAYEKDVAEGFGKWDSVRMINRLGEERIYKK